MIYLDNSANGTNIDVSDYQTLPDKGKWKKVILLDRNFGKIIESWKYKGVEKKRQG